MTKRRSFAADQRGAAFVEFLVAFIPLWIFFLCTLQLAFTATARLIVQHATDCAARAAVLVLPDDPAAYDGPEDKLRAIRAAALAPLTPLAPSRPGKRASIARAIDASSAAASAYSDAALSLSLSTPAERTGGRELRVRLRYAYACQVPIARELLCSGWLGVRDELDGPFRGLVSRFPGSRLLPLEHEVTLLLHEAGYDYEPPGQS